MYVNLYRMYVFLNVLCITFTSWLKKITLYAFVWTEHDYLRGDRIFPWLPFTPLGVATDLYFLLHPLELLTDAQTHCDATNKEDHFALGDTHNNPTATEDEAGDEDANPAPQPPVQEAPAEGGERRGSDGAGHQQLLPQGAQVHLLLQEQHRSGDHPRVIPEEESTQGREKRQQVDETRGRWGVLIPEALPGVMGRRSNETPLSILCSFLPPAACAVTHRSLKLLDSGESR